MKKIILALFSLVFSLGVMADAIGTWTLYPSYNEVTKVVPTGKDVFVQAGKNLYSYNPATSEVRSYNTSTGLSGVSIKDIEWVAGAQRLVVLYEDMTIDLLPLNGNIVTISDYANKQITGDKAINSLAAYGKYAYLCTAFGIVQINVAGGYIADTYDLGRSVKNVAVSGDYILARTDDAIYSGSTRNNLYDRANWKIVNENQWDIMGTMNGQAVAAVNGRLAKINPSNGEETTITDVWYSKAVFRGTTFIGYLDNVKVYCVTQDFKKTVAYYDFPISDMGYDNTSNCFWGNNTANELVRYSIADEKLSVASSGVIADGPAIQSSYRLAVNNGRLYSTTGGWGLGEELNHGGEVMTYINGTWGQFETSEIAAKTGIRYGNSHTVAIDPYDPEHAFVSSFNGLYEFRSGKFVRRYGTADGLQTYDNNPNKEYHVIVTDIKYDGNGQLWGINCASKNPLFCITKDGKLHVITESVSTTTATAPDYGGLSIDGNLVWFTHFSKYHTPIVFCYNTADGKMYKNTTFFNQDQRPIPLTVTYSTAVDRKNNVWLATDDGPMYFTPQGKSTWELTQHKVPRNDGTNLADYLLDGIPCRKVAVDIQNRKWIGTERNGVFLISNDCNTQISHFTSADSPLLSDRIYDILVDDKEGRVYFATDKGLCSYYTGVTEAGKEMAEDNVWAYPNPVTPNYNGLVTIVGLEENSQVKILTASGALVSEGVSNNGYYKWDCCDLEGNRVASGVYMVNVSTSEGESGVVTKVAIIR